MGFLQSIMWKSMVKSWIRDRGINGYGPDGMTLLHKAVGFQYLEGVQYLLDHGADVNMTDQQDGLPPIFVAAGLGLYDIAAVLIKYGASVNAVGKMGLTPLHMAANTGNLNLVILLVSRGADVHARTTDGDTPDDRARRHGYRDIVSYLHAQKS